MSEKKRPRKSAWERKAAPATAKAINRLALIRERCRQLAAESKALCNQIIRANGGRTRRWEARIHHRVGGITRYVRRASTQVKLVPLERNRANES